MLAKNFRIALVANHQVILFSTDQGNSYLQDLRRTDIHTFRQLALNGRHNHCHCSLQQCTL